MEKSVPPTQAGRFGFPFRKAEIRDSELRADNLTLDRIMAIFTADLCRRSVDFQMPSDPLAENAWILLLQRIYADPTNCSGTQ
jgi:hypothetical protein